MSRARTIFNNYLSERIPVQALGFFRIAIAVFALLQCIVLLPNWNLLFDEKGIIPWVISDALATKQTLPVSSFAALLRPMGLSAQAAMIIISVVYVVSLIFLLAGYQSRTAAILAWFTHSMLNSSAHLTAYGVENFLHIALFYCAVFPVGVSMGFDGNRDFYKRVSPRTITLCIRVLQCHLAIMYCASGIEKGLGQQWWNGEAIWIALQQEQFRQVDTTWMARLAWIPTLLGWGTVLAETTFPFTMNYSRTRRAAFCAVIAMHFFIGVFLGLHLFALLMILLNFSAFGWKVFPRLFMRITRASSVN